MLFFYQCRKNEQERLALTSMITSQERSDLITKWIAQLIIAVRDEWERFTMTKTKINMQKNYQKRVRFFSWGGRFWQTIPNGNHDSLGHNSSNRLERFSFFFLILLSLKDVCRLLCTKERI
jgi:hypothetical protein